MRSDDSIALTLFAVIGMLEPHSAAGAAFGCVFYLSLPRGKDESRFLLPVFSLGIGYAVGLAVGHPHAMWSATVAAALASTVLNALHATIKEGGDLPEWLKSVVHSILRIKK